MQTLLANVHQPALGLLLGLPFLLTAACAPGPQRPSPSGADAPSSAPKTLILAIMTTEEVRDGGFAYGASGTGGSEPAYIVHAGLTVYDDQASLQPRIIQRVPTLENGDWKVLPDGTMEVTWNLRPDVFWHDGAPLTAEEIVLGYRVGLDPDLFLRGTRVLSQIADVTAPSPQTVLMRWKNIYISANEMALSTLVPLHRNLGPLYAAGDKQAFASSTLLSDEWVGLGPYKLREWLRGSYIDVLAFDQYFLGKPKIDRVTIRYIGDTNTLVVTAIAGEIHVVSVGALREQEAHVLNTQWTAGTVLLSPVGITIGEWQFRDPQAPWARDARVRTALVRLIDRQALVDTILNGISGVDDLLVTREDPVYRLARQRTLPDLSFNVAEAHRLLAASGLNRGSDGTYRTPSSTPFTIELAAQGDQQSRVQLILAIGNQWKTAGVEPNNHFISGTTDWRVPASQMQGAYISRQSFGAAPSSFTTNEISSEANRFRGANRGGYSNPSFDELYNRFWTTLASSERDQIGADVAKLLLDEMVYLPLTYVSDAAAVGKTVRGVTKVTDLQRVTSWNIHTWSLQ